MITAAKNRLREGALDPKFVKRFRARVLEEAWSAAPPGAAAPAERIDRANGVIHSVKVCGLFSRCPARFIGIASDAPYSYTEAALQQAVSLYEGAHVNVDHPPLKIEANGERVPAVESFNMTADKRFGQLRNVVFVPGEGLFADLHFLRAHPLAERVCEAAERMPTLFCLSHNVLMRPEMRGDQVAIAEIIEVESVDLIGAKGGTNNSLYESGVPTMPLPLHATDDEHREATEAEGEGASAAAPAAPPKLTVGDAFRVLLQAILDDDTLPSAETIAKVEALMADLGIGGAAEKAGESATTESGPQALSTDGAMRALESFGVAITTARVNAYQAGTEAIRQELVAGWKQIDGQPKPRGRSERPASRPAVESSASGATRPAQEPREASLGMLRR